MTRQADRKRVNARQSGKPKHLIVKWNPSTEFEPDTIAAHARILRAASDTNAYVWWGKISKSKRQGVALEDISGLKRQLADGVETHLYLYCPDKAIPSLHVGLISAIMDRRPKETERIPNYYLRFTYPIPLWFKLIDIRELSVEHLRHLAVPSGTPFDPVSANRYPAIVLETGPLNPFDYRNNGGVRWYILQQLDRPGHTAADLDPNFVFVLMPSSEQFTDIWKLGIKPRVEGLKFMDSKLRCERADEFMHTREIMEVIRESIRKARLIIADMTGNNSNVFYELGYAHALNKPVILVTQKRDEVPFDLRGLSNIEYRSASSLKEQLPAKIKAILRTSGGARR